MKSQSNSFLIASSEQGLQRGGLQTPPYPGYSKSQNILPKCLNFCQLLKHWKLSLHWVIFPLWRESRVDSLPCLDGGHVLQFAVVPTMPFCVMPGLLHSFTTSYLSTEGIWICNPWFIFRFVLPRSRQEVLIIRNTTLYEIKTRMQIVRDTSRISIWFPSLKSENLYSIGYLYSS